MAIEIREHFSVPAPVDVVWRFLIEPKQVVTCMPGASLDEIVDDTHFVGSVKIKLGAVKTQYKCTIELTSVDEAEHSVRIVARGRESGGGTMKGTLNSGMRALPDGQTEVAMDARVDLTGRIAQLGQAMVQSVGRELFGQFADNVRGQLEGEPSAAPGATEPAEAAPLGLWSVLVASLRRAIGRWLGRRD